MKQKPNRTFWKTNFNTLKEFIDYVRSKLTPPYFYRVPKIHKANIPL